MHPDLTTKFLRGRWGLSWIIAALLLPAGGVWAQERQTRVTPTFTTSLTWTDNVDATRRKESDWLLELSPGLRVEREGGRMRGLLGARLRSVFHARDSGRNTTFVDLQGTGSFEAVENSLFIDADANIGRENRSAFSGRAYGDALSVNKDNEVRSWGLGPRLQFRVGDAAEGAVRYRSSWLDSGQNGFGKQRQNLWTGQLGNPRATRLLGWDVSVQDARTRYSSSRQETTRKLGRATLYVNLGPQFRLRFTGGHESDDFGYGSKERGGVYGAGFDWNPTPRTAISVLTEERAYGSGYTASFRHRTARTIWTLAANRDISSALDSMGGGLYQDPRFQTYYNDPALVAQFPDPVQREAYIRQILGYGAAGGTANFISNAHFLDEGWRAGVTLNGRRSALTLSVYHSRRKRLSAGSGLAVTDDFALTDRIETSAVNVAFNHRLTPRSTFNAALMRSRSEGGAGAKLDTWRTMGSVGLTTRLGGRTQAGLTYRYQSSDGATVDSDYSENSVTADLGLSF
ncbi:hypothetical protein AGMMS49543_06670 [Betaproteobacteria bacterium]|nr:hypothetical protein AGMMS49543_06670 [Betaproteobacteria bacterium]GHU18096.1 hypothetical protein AGMMS50243_07500 [Betaproteobacteria bacterium]